MRTHERVRREIFYKVVQRWNFLETKNRFSENVECNLQHSKLLSLAQLLQIFVPNGPVEFHGPIDGPVDGPVAFQQVNNSL